MMSPQFAVYRDGERLEDVIDRLAPSLSGEENREFDCAVQQAKQDGTLFVCEPFHCAVSQK